MINAFIQLLFPHTCVLCAERSNQSRDLCTDCEKELPWANLACKQCGIKLSAASTSDICGECQQHPPAFDKVFALCNYAEPIDRLIKAAKFRHQLVYTRLLGDLLAKQVHQDWYKSQPLPSLLIPVPLHATRLKERGYNQSLEITKAAAKILRLPYAHDYCRRQKATLPQSDLAHDERGKNVFDAFVLKKPRLAPPKSHTTCDEREEPQVRV
ncbi:MAG: double zinc ribbon domain-containing protein, partial [Gammaproteobacteria bacterium]|nr:double zinc ribbon domain-containing protein [Gammaproteobacteria bacterium]